MQFACGKLHNCPAMVNCVYYYSKLYCCAVYEYRGSIYVYHIELTAIYN